MLLDTKQVRAMGKAFAGFGAQYTDKTLTDKANKRRSVVWHFTKAEDANALAAHFKAQGITNEVTRTSVTWYHQPGGEYVRVKALIA